MILQWSKPPVEIVREFLHNVDDRTAEYVLWNFTGFPGFWRIPDDGDTPEACLRKQLQAFSDRTRPTTAIRVAEQMQMERDCAALCDACKRGVAAERVIGGIWSHREPPHYNTVTCAGHPLRAAWAGRQEEGR